MVNYEDYGNEPSLSMKYGEILLSRAMVGFPKGFFCVKPGTVQTAVERRNFDLCCNAYGLYFGVT